MKSRAIVLSVIAIPVLAAAGFYIYLCYFWKPDIFPLRQFGDVAAAKASDALAPLTHASLVVVYDERGRMSLVGPGAKNDSRRFDNIAELRSALIALHGKGSAFVFEMNSAPIKATGQSGMETLLAPAGPAPSVNFELEREIRDSLVAAGFTPANDPTPAYDLHRVPGPPN